MTLLSVSARSVRGLGLALLLAATSGSASGQTIVQGHYEQTVGPASGTAVGTISGTHECAQNAPFCNFVFDPVPKGKLLIVTTANCAISISNSALPIAQITLSTVVGPSGTTYGGWIGLPAALYGTDGTISYFVAMATPISKIYMAGQSPLVSVQTKNQVSSGTCTIEGTITP
jgi:hypothetical protein